jgi:hypothetical protein
MRFILTALVLGIGLAAAGRIAFRASSLRRLPLRRHAS